MKSEKKEITERKEQPNQERIRMLREKENFGILEADTMKEVKMKEKIRKE